MSAEVTFVTKEIKDVLYISNKAVTTEGTKSYVTKKKVTEVQQRHRLRQVSQMDIMFR